jgi:hypothetical protein
MRYAWLLAAALLVWPSSGQAEPSDAINALMKSPLSMLDWGMYQMLSNINQVAKTGKTYEHGARVTGGRVFYDADRGRILVLVDWTVPDNSSFDRAFCDDLLKRSIRSTGIAPDNSPMPPKETAIFTLDRMFGPEMAGKRRASMPFYGPDVLGNI